MVREFGYFIPLAFAEEAVREGDRLRAARARDRNDPPRRQRPRPSDPPPEPPAEEQRRAGHGWASGLAPAFGASRRSRNDDDDDGDEGADEGEDEDEESDYEEEEDGESSEGGEPSDDEGPGEDIVDADPDRVILCKEWMYTAQLVHDETTYVARLQRVQVHGDRADYYASVQQHQAEVKITGEDRFNLFVHLVRAGFVWRLKKFQLRFFELIMQTMAENIVGATWSTEGERIMRKHGWRSSPKVCAASAPRRFGKTVTLAVVMCAYALVMPGKIQSVFSTGSRASGGLRDLVRKTLDESGMRDLLMTRGTQQETVLVRSIFSQGPQFSTMNFYPSDEKVSSLSLSARARAPPHTGYRFGTWVCIGKKNTCLLETFYGIRGGHLSLCSLAA